MEISFSRVASTEHSIHFISTNAGEAHSRRRSRITIRPAFHHREEHSHRYPGVQRRIEEPAMHNFRPRLWSLHGASRTVIGKRIWKSLNEDRIFGRAAELSFYFLFALFPTLLSASWILGLAAKSGPAIYDKLLNYLALVIPTSALSTVLTTFNQTTAASTPGKVTFALIASIWSASVGISAIQDTLNSVYHVQETRSYLRARIAAIGLTIVLTAVNTLTLASMLGGDFMARTAAHSLTSPLLIDLAESFSRVLGWAIATGLLVLSFAITYCYAPNRAVKRWYWLSPGAAFGILGWLLASLGLRLYLHFFNSYALTYGSLGAVIILLTWFYITGLMLLVGAEIDSAIEAVAVGEPN